MNDIYHGKRYDIPMDTWEALKRFNETIGVAIGQMQSKGLTPPAEEKEDSKNG